MSGNVVVMDVDEQVRRPLLWLNFTVACLVASVGTLVEGASEWPAGRGFVVVGLVQLLLWILVYGKTSSTARKVIAASGAFFFLGPLPVFALADMGFAKVPGAIVWGTLYVSLSYLAYAAFGVVTRRGSKVVYQGDGVPTGATRLNTPSHATPVADALMTDVSESGLGPPLDFGW